MAGAALVLCGGGQWVLGPILEGIGHRVCRCRAKQPRQLGSAVLAQHIFRYGGANSCRHTHKTKQRSTTAGLRQVVDFCQGPACAAGLA